MLVVIILMFGFEIGMLFGLMMLSDNEKLSRFCEIAMIGTFSITFIAAIVVLSIEFVLSIQW